MSSLQFPWLEAMIVLPLIGAAWVWQMRSSAVAHKWSAVFCGATLLCAIGAWLDFYQIDRPVATSPWETLEPIVGPEFLVIDRFSAPLLPLASLLFLLLTVATLRTKAPRYSFNWALLSEALVLATLCCREAWGVTLLLTLGALPPLRDLRARGAPTRVYVIHMAASSLFLAAGCFVVQQSGPTTLAVILVTLGVMIKSGLAPFHCWMTDLFEHAAFGTSLLFVTPMLGSYAALRLLLPIASNEALRLLGMLALATAVYSAGMALVQKEARRFYCYVFLSHSALVLVGLDAVSHLALTGALCVWLSIGLSMTGFGLTLRALEARHGRLTLTAFHGNYEHTPLLAICFLLTGMASVGFPGTFGFVGTELLVDGAVQAYPIVGIAVVTSAALNGIAVMKAYFLLFTGTRRVASVSLLAGPREKLAALALLGLILGGGIWPAPSVVSRHKAANTILNERAKKLGMPLTQETADEHLRLPWPMDVLGSRSLQSRHVR